MKHILLSAGCWLLAASAASAQLLNIDTVIVDHAGNPAQSETTRDHTNAGGDGLGAVVYNYHIGRTPVTNAQYTAFLNAVASSDPHGLWNENMGSSVHGGIDRSGTDGSYTYSVRTATSGFNNGQSMANMPVNFVSFWDAARFANWLTTGDTETGVYNLGGVTTPTNNAITRDATAWANGGVAIASADEWHKAAYYNPSTSKYNLFATGFGSGPRADDPNSVHQNSANYRGHTSPSAGPGGPNTVTEVGSYTVAGSHYGTFDQAGNVSEWTETIWGEDDLMRYRTGGGFSTGSFNNLRAGTDLSNLPTEEHMAHGFRVTSLNPIPEPSTYAAILGCLGLLLALMRRRGRGNL